MLFSIFLGLIACQVYAVSSILLVTFFIQRLQTFFTIVRFLCF